MRSDFFFNTLNDGSRPRVGSSVRVIIPGYPWQPWLRDGIQVDCGLVPSNGLTMIGVFFLNFWTDSCYLLLHLLLT